MAKRENPSHFETTDVVSPELENWLARRLLEHDHRVGVIDAGQLEKGLADLKPVAVADKHEDSADGHST